jgi:uncharacterized protein YjgD (DUF1641 family)
MAKPIPLLVPPRDPRAELRDRLDRAPEEHAEAILAAYDVLQEMHNQGVLTLLHGLVAARDDVINTLAKDSSTPTAIRVIRNLLFGSRLLNLNADPGNPPGLFTLFRRMQSEDSRRALAVTVGFLESFGRHLKSLDGEKEHQ